MRSSREGLLEPLGWALLRAPLRAVEAYPAGTPDPASESTVDSDGELAAALAVGSRDLLSALRRPAASERDDVRRRRKLLRYLIRMSTRPTPYGLFAGVALVGWGPVTNLALAGGAPVTRTRPDMEWLMALVAELEADPAIRRHLRLVANPLAFVQAGRVFLAEPAYAIRDDGSRQPVSVRATGPVIRTLELARRPISYEQLGRELQSFSEATVPKVEQLIDDLWRHTILLSDLRPPLTCGNPGGYVAGRLRTIPSAAGTCRQLEDMHDFLAQWDRCDLQTRAEAWPDLVARVSSVHRPAASSSPVQLDMALRLGGTRIHPAIGAEAAKAAELLLRMNPYLGGSSRLASYSAAFEARYEYGREVPLLELLDPGFGLGALNGHGHPPPAGSNERAARRQQVLRDLALEAYRDHQMVVDVDDSLLDSLEQWAPQADELPISVELSVFVAASSSAAIDAGDFLVVVGPNLGAPAAGRNLGRFADLLGADAMSALQQLAAAEDAAAPGHVIAELNYAPHHARSANVTVHPPVRRYEIVLGTTPGVAWDHVIAPRELVVGLRHGRFYVRWPRANVEVLVAQGHMLNPAQAPQVGQFLLEVASQGHAQLSPFDWGPAAGFLFLPRIQRGRVVLSPAQWRIDPSANGTALAAAPADAFAVALSQWRVRHRLARHVYLTSGDNRLLLDLEESSHADLLAHEIRGLPPGASVLLQEALPGRTDAWLQGPNGHHLSELVIPLRRRPRRSGPNESVARPPNLQHAPVPGTTRLRPPGSDWLYLKLYHPPAFADELIAGPLRSFAQMARSSGLAEGWFFIRYADPDPHLRLRFHGDPQSLLGPLLTAACEWATELLARGQCRRFGFDGYEREVERYGGDEGLQVAELIFGGDSACVASLLAGNARDDALDLETTAMLAVDDLLASTGLNEGQRLDWYRAHVALSAGDGHVYRHRQALLRRLLGDPDASSAEPSTKRVKDILAVRHRVLARVPDELNKLESDRKLTQSQDVLRRSYVHLHCNRLLGPDGPTEQHVLALLRRTREGLARAPIT